MTKSMKHFDVLPRQTYSRLYNNNYSIPVAANSKLTFANSRLKERVAERHTLVYISIKTIIWYLMAHLFEHS
jgi:hypothetical protein